MDAGVIASVIAATLNAGTPLLIAAIGILIHEKSGVLNLGVEGMMLMGAVTGFGVTYATGSFALGFLAGALAGLVMAALFGFFTLGLYANQYAAGLALSLFGAGLSAFVGQPLQGMALPSRAPTGIPGLESIPFLGDAFFSSHCLVYLSLIGLAAVGWFLYKSRPGLMLRAVGDSVTPLWFLALSVALNIVLDLFFILQLDWGIEGAAIATVMAQGVASAGIVLYTWRKRPELRLHIGDMRFDRGSLKEIVSFSTLTCVQQSVMNFGILMIQGLVNSFGTAVMAAFAAAVKIDSFAYMPVQEFGNAFSTFIAQNFGAKRYGRIRRGVRSALLTTVIFSIIVSVLVFVFAEPLMLIFVHPGETEILATGVEYLRIEGAFYCGIGILFLLYGYYRAVRKPGMSVVLTVISLGTRVALSYLLAAIPSVGVTGIWWSIPIGWLLADAVGMLYYKMKNGA